MLWTLQRVFLGALKEEHKTLPDLTTRELIAFVPLAIIVIFLGVYPAPAIDLMNASLSYLVEVVRTGGEFVIIP